MQFVCLSETVTSCGETPEQHFRCSRERAKTIPVCGQQQTATAAAWRPTAPCLTLTEERPVLSTGSRWWSGHGRVARRCLLSVFRRSRTTKWPLCSERSGATRAKEKLWTCSPWTRISCAGVRYYTILPDLHYIFKSRLLLIRPLRVSGGARVCWYSCSLSSIRDVTLTSKTWRTSRM